MTVLRRLSADSALGRPPAGRTGRLVGRPGSRRAPDGRARVPAGHRTGGRCGPRGARCLRGGGSRPARPTAVPEASWLSMASSIRMLPAGASGTALRTAQRRGRQRLEGLVVGIPPQVEPEAGAGHEHRGGVVRVPVQPVRRTRPVVRHRLEVVGRTQPPGERRTGRPGDRDDAQHQHACVGDPVPRHAERSATSGHRHPWRPPSPCRRGLRAGGRARGRAVAG